MEANEGGYKHRGNVELSTILLENIMTTYGKTFIKTENLVYFNEIKKHNTVWDHSTQLLDI